MIVNVIIDGFVRIHGALNCKTEDIIELVPGNVQAVRSEVNRYENNKQTYIY